MPESNSKLLKKWQLEENYHFFKVHLGWQINDHPHSTAEKRANFTKKSDNRSLMLKHQTSSIVAAQMKDGWNRSCLYSFIKIKGMFMKHKYAYILQSSLQDRFWSLET